MMRITIGKNADGLVKYFSGNLSKDDYFFTGESTKGYYYGHLREELGLPKEVSQKTFSALANNRHPLTGKQLTKRQNKTRRTSIEYMFSAPKSVSLVMALSDEQTARDILNAHRLAVRKAMTEIELDMQTQTTIQGRKVYVDTGKIIWAKFDHFTSRPTYDENTPGSTPVSDPNLHSHCVVFNITKYNESFQALEGSTIHKTAQYYEHLYHAHLSRGLQSLGFDIRRDRKRYEIYAPGMTRRTLEKFSRRTMEVEAEAQKRGITSIRQKSQLGARTRKSKASADPNVNVKQEWLARLTVLEKRAIRQARKTPQPSQNTISAQKAIDLALKHHLERRSTVATKIVLAEAMKLGYGRLKPKALKDELQARENVIYGRSRYIQYLTTIERIREEDRMIAFATQGRSTMRALHPRYRIERDFLNGQQQKAIKAILSSQDQVMALVGGAGTGKTTVLQEIHSAHLQQNKRVIALAQSAAASRDVLVENGFKGADTLARFFRDKDLQSQAKNQTILVDEAGLLGVGAMDRLFKIAHRQNARVLLVGDTRQHGSPVYGDGLRLLLEKGNIQAARIEEIQRQKANPKYKSAIKALAKGETRKGFDRLDKMGAVVEMEDVRIRHQALAKDYVQSVDQRRSALAISPTHIEGAQVSEAIRREMKDRGRISGKDRSFTINRNINLTEAQKRDSSQYERGMVVQFFQNTKGGFQAGQIYMVKRQDQKDVILSHPNNTVPELKLPRQMADRYQVFTQDTLVIAKGEQIRITQNGRTIDGKRINNGQVFEVAGFTDEGHLKLNGNRVLDKNFGHFTYGYCSTSHSSQGRTCDDVFIAQSGLSRGAGNQQQFYVSASRAKHRIRIYTDDKEELRRTISKTGSRLSARELAGDRFKKQRRRSRHQFYDRIIKTFKRHEKSFVKHQRDLQRTLDL